jgi:hypothetical protein
MKFQYLGKEVQCEALTLKEAIEKLSKNDSDFRVTFLESNGCLKWNCIVIRNNTAVDITKPLALEQSLTDKDEFFLMLQLSGG